MNKLLLATGLTIAKRRVAIAMNRVFVSIVAYAVLLLAVLVSAGFLTAAGFFYLLETASVIEACSILAGVYALISSFGFVLLRLLRNRAHRFDQAAMVNPSSPALDPVGGEQLPLGIMSLGLLAGVSYLLGRSIGSKR